MHKHLPSRKANNVITNITAVLLLFIGLLHFLRTVYGWEATVGNVAIPVWISGFAMVLAIYVAYKLFLMDK